MVMEISTFGLYSEKGTEGTSTLVSLDRLYQALMQNGLYLYK